MATSISINVGSITDTSIAISMTVHVTYKGTYKIKYGISGYDDSIDESYVSSNFTLSEGGSTSNPYKKFTGLTPGSRYYIWCQLWNAETNKNLGIEDSVIESTTGSLPVLTITYRDGSSKRTDTSSAGGSLTIRSSGLSRPSGYSFVGWSRSTNSTDVDFTGGESAKASGSDQSMTLYAVYSKSMSNVTCYFGVNRADSNTRSRTQWRVNSGTTSTTTMCTMSPSYLPTFSSSSVTVGNFTYSAIGWRDDTTAGSAEYSAGETLSSSEISNLPTSLYAVYSRTVTISYNSNGGSGSMSNSTGTSYYNSYGNTTVATITLRSCTFTPPTGKTFNYWALGSASGTQYTDSITTNYNSTMYAVWKGSPPAAWSWSGVVTFNGTNHSCPIASGGSVPVVKKSDTLYYAFYMNASEWNEFCTQINKLRNYHGLSNYSFSRATAGYEMQASQYNQAANALNGIQSGSVSTISAGATVSASHFKALATAFNNLR